jgi:predicted ATP-dependent endonuclease of OLD family
VRPITLLVGRNSSGKSSFLRAFPLLRQSITTRTSAPVLWFGDYVDLGDYRAVVSDGDIRSEIGLRFELDRIDFNMRRRSVYIDDLDDPGSDRAAYRSQAHNVSVEYRLKLDGMTTRFSAVRFQSELGELSPR